MEIYRVGFKGLLVQPVGEGGVLLVERGRKVKIRRGFTKYCIWHSADIREKDDPLTRTYCTRESETVHGFCRTHQNTPRAIYHLCFVTGGDRSLEYCRMLDKLVGEASYISYMVVFGNRIKVGSTRKWRFIERISEQPHTLAVVLREFTNSSSARGYELKMSRLFNFSEHLKISFRDLKKQDPARDASLLSSYLKKIQPTTIGETRTGFIRIEPDDPRLLEAAVESRLEEVVDSRLEVDGFYAGYILFYDIDNNNYIAVKASQILHTDSIVLVD
ncbi:hypothetical protein ACSU1N_04945 [Thermogladius sp. 4427co]|uniref:hypothetical protein n=1 Tax=Thermogladius sp. 4427co TaxID=3450718 RepID=UPI003F78D7A2